MGVEDLSLAMWGHQDASLIFIVLFGLIFLAGIFNKRTVIAMVSLLGCLSLSLLLYYGRGVQFGKLESYRNLSYKGQLCKNVWADKEAHTFLLDCVGRKLKVRQMDVSIPYTKKTMPMI